MQLKWKVWANRTIPLWILHEMLQQAWQWVLPQWTHVMLASSSQFPPYHTCYCLNASSRIADKMCTMASAVMRSRGFSRASHLKKNQETELQGAQVYYYSFISLYTIYSLGWWIATSFSVKEECEESYRRDLLLQVAMRALDFNVKEEARCEVACRAACQQWVQ